MFEISTELKALADKVIAKYSRFKPIIDSGCRIAYQYADKEKKSGDRTVYADTTKVSDKLKAIAPYDFLITFYKPSCAMLSEEKMETLMRHELDHVGVEDGKFRIVPHDVEDFEEILKEQGMNWIV